MTMKDQYIKAY